MITLDKNNILMNLDCSSDEQVLGCLADRLRENGYVNNDFRKAILEREKKFPTGLPATAFDVAMPHTESEYVIKPTVALALLKHPVEFAQMGSPDIILHPSLVIMLAMKDPDAHMKMLSRLMKLLQNPEELKKLAASKDESEALQILQTNLL